MNNNHNKYLLIITLNTLTANFFFLAFVCMLQWTPPFFKEMLQCTYVQHSLR